MKIYFLDTTCMKPRKDYKWAKNHINNITKVLESMEPLWQMVNTKTFE